MTMLTVSPITTTQSTTTDGAVPRLVSTAELALVLGVSVRTITRMRRAEEIPALQVRSRWRYDLREVLHHLRRQAAHP